MDKLTKVNACGACLTPAMVMIAIVGAVQDHEVPTYARMHEAQRVSWHHCAIMANDVEFGMNELPNYPFIKETVGGVPIVVDNKLCPGTVVFHNANDKPVARIECLAIPIGVGEEFPTLCNCNSLEEVERRTIEEGWLFQ